MATLAEFRAEYPQYNDVPDVKLADSLHQKFYANIPKMDFYKTIGLGSATEIPGAENVVTKPAPEVSLRDRIMGVIETPAALASGLAGSVVAPVAGVIGSLTSGKYGTQAGVQAGEQAAQAARAQFYQPRTETAKQILGGIGNVLEPLTGALPPTFGTAGANLNAMAGPAMMQAGAIARPVIGQTAPMRNALANVLTREQPAMQGMGAATTQEDMLRAERAQRQNIRLLKGEQQQNLGQLQFESETAKNFPETLGKPLLEAKAAQKADILKRMDIMAEETGAQGALSDSESYRTLGNLLDKELVNAYEGKKTKVDVAYQKARAANETKAVVDTTVLDDYLTSLAAEALSVPEINSISAKLKAFKELRNGQVTIDDIESIYQIANKLGKPGETSGKYMKDIKNVLDQVTEGAGGDLYKAARTQRRELANQFDDNFRVAELLGTKAGYADRKVALDDVFKHIVLDGSKEQMQNVAVLLKKAGPEGRQAWAEVQGQTIQHMKNQLTKPVNGELSFANLKTTIDKLDSEGKLSYLFGKNGRDQIIDLRETIKDALVKPPGAVNYSNTASAMVRFFDTLKKTDLPFTKMAAETARKASLGKKVEEAVNFNALAPAQPNKNALRIDLTGMANGKE
jgi:hypothetical protein